jgi:phage terminase Nu1 subunit (DNA packaging protein)
MTGSSADVADMIGISSRRVKELRADGVLPGAPRDPYDVRACVRAYCSHIRPSAGKAASGGSDAAVDVDTARVRLMTAQAIAREVLNTQLRGESVLNEDMEAIVGAVLDGVRSKLLGVPTKAAPHLLGMSNLAELRDKLTGFIHAACDELADAGAVCDSVTDRARRRAGRGAAGESSDEPAADAAPVIRKRVGRQV